MIEIILALVVGIVLIYVVAKIISLPFKILWKLISNSVMGALMLWAVTLLGVPVHITFLSALVAGVFGIPGVIAVIVYYLR